MYKNYRGPEPLICCSGPRKRMRQSLNKVSSKVSWALMRTASNWVLKNCRNLNSSCWAGTRSGKNSRTCCCCFRMTWRSLIRMSWSGNLNRTRWIPNFGRTNWTLRTVFPRIQDLKNGRYRFSARSWKTWYLLLRSALRWSL